MEATRLQTSPQGAFSRFRASCDLFLISLLLLFVELASIRWFPAHVLFLTFFTNVVLLASFLGISVGCLAAGRQRNYLTWTPALLFLAMAAAQGAKKAGGLFHRVLDVGHQISPQMVFFGTEAANQDAARFVIPIEVLNGFFFLVIALAFIGPGQELGRALGRLPDRIVGYTLNILGSLVGILLFAFCSWCELSPFWWFLPVALGLAYFLGTRLPPGTRPLPLVFQGGLLLALLGLAGLTVGTAKNHGQVVAEHFWSPYYRIDYDPGTAEKPSRSITVNLIGHQGMVSRERPTPAYALPHALNRDSGGQPFQDVLIIGAGSGNDVSRALQWGAQHVDAVEIDPVIQRLGQQHHPDQPYQDPRVTVSLDDGRNFLRSSTKKYDLVVYALVDSLVLHSSYSNIRLESYLFTSQAFSDIKEHLKPGGLFVTYNYFRQGWIVDRIHQGLARAFGADPLVLSLPYSGTIQPEDSLFGSFTFVCAGDTQRIEAQFQQHSFYWLRANKAPQLDTAQTPNGFMQSPTPEEQAHWTRFGLANVVLPAEPLRLASDDWPFLYLRQPMIPNLNLRGMAIMGGLAVLLLFLFVRRSAGEERRGGFDWRLFFLGAGFMLLETKAVVHMALLFGSTWMVNSLVFFAVLVMILAANLFVLQFRPERLWPYYVGLLATLALNTLVPLDFFLGMSWAVQVAGSCLLVSLPVLFAGVIFAVSFSRCASPEHAFGANIAGAMLGGLAEYSSMLLGFQNLVLVAFAFYALSAVVFQRSKIVTEADMPSRKAA